jgi:hypothetical protein
MHFMYFSPEQYVKSHSGATQRIVDIDVIALPALERGAGTQTLTATKKEEEHG